MHNGLEWNEVTPGVYEFKLGRVAVKPVLERGRGAYVSEISPAIRLSAAETLLHGFGISYNQRRFDRPEPPFDAWFHAYADLVLDPEAPLDYVISIINRVAATQAEIDARKKHRHGAV